LNIGLSPFIKVCNDGALNVYSIALENTEQNFEEKMCNTCNYFTLGSSSVIAIDKVMNKVLKLYKVIPHRTINIEDLSKHELYVKAFQPQYNYALFLNDKGILGRIAILNNGISIESLHHCQKYNVSKCELFNVFVCIDSSIFTAISSHVYGFSTELNAENRLRSIDISKIYGYIKNNVYFIKFGRKGFILNLASPDELNKYYEVEDVEPIAFINDGNILALDNNSMLILMDLENNNSIILNRVRWQNVVEYSTDSSYNFIAVVTDDSIYIYNIQGTPTYARIPTNDASSVVLAKDKFMVFRKNYIDLYYIDINPSHLYIEKIATMSKLFTNCVPLEENLVLCIDRMGRIVLLDFEKLLDLVPKVKVLQSSSGSTLYILNGLTPLMINPAYENSLIRVKTNQCLLRVENSDVNDVLIPSIELKINPYRVFIEMPSEINKVQIIQINDKHIIVSKPNISDDKVPIKYFYSYSSAKTSMYAKALPSLYAVKIYNNVEWGVHLGKVNLVKLDVNELLKYNQDKLCLNKDELEKISNTLSFRYPSLTAICSNTIIEGMCIDLSSCSKLLKLILEVEGRYISLPLHVFNKPRLVFKDDIFEPNIIYDHGTCQVVLPKKCIELQNAYLNIFESKVFLKIDNRCRNIWGIAIAENNIFLIKPQSRDAISIAIDWSHIVSDNGIQILIFEATGYVHRYTIPFTFKDILTIVINTALKIAKMLGIRSSDIKVPSNVYEDFNQIAK